MSSVRHEALSLPYHKRLYHAMYRQMRRQKARFDPAGPLALELAAMLGMVRRKIQMRVGGSSKILGRTLTKKLGLASYRKSHFPDQPLADCVDTKILAS